MRDGVRLKADLYTADTEDLLTPRPTVLQRTPYSRAMAQYVDAAVHLAEHGYACVIQDARGRNDSEGEWRAHEQEGADGFDTIEWVAAQPFSNGAVGTLGGSYPGWVQFAALAENPPALRTMIVTSSDLQQMKAYGYNGETVIPRALLWVHKMSDRFSRDDLDAVDWETVLRTTPLSAAADSLPEETRAMWQRWMAHPELVESDPVRPGADLRIPVPTLHISGWEDEPGQLRLWARSVAAGDEHQALVVGPWDHPGTRNPQRITRGIDHGEDAVIDMETLYTQWFDRWLKVETTASEQVPEPAVRLFTTGSRRWHGFGRDWLTAAPATQFVPTHEGSRNRLLSDGGDQAAGDAVELSFVHDPDHPVQPYSALELGDTATVNDLRRLDEHRNVISFDLDPGDEGFDIAGGVEVRLDTRADSTVADWCVWLADVDDRGHAVRLTNDTARTRYASPGQQVTVTVALGPISHRVRPGHRLRMYVAGSNFPTVDIAGARSSSTAGGDGRPFGMYLRVGTTSSTRLSVPSVTPHGSLTPAEVTSFQPARRHR